MQFHAPTEKAPDCRLLCRSDELALGEFEVYWVSLVLGQVADFLRGSVLRYPSYQSAFVQVGVVSVFLKVLPL